MASSTPTLRHGDLTRALLAFSASRETFTSADLLDAIGPLYGAEECVRTFRRVMVSRRKTKGWYKSGDPDLLHMERSGRQMLVAGILKRSLEHGHVVRVSRAVYRKAGGESS